MAGLVVDTGALIAIERGDRIAAKTLEAVRHEGVEAVTSSACIAEAWRAPERQVRLVRALAGILERPLDEEVARACGVLLARSRTDDVVDAAVALLAQSGDTVLTSDPEDIERLLTVAGTDAAVRRV